MLTNLKKAILTMAILIFIAGAIGCTTNDAPKGFIGDGGTRASLTQVGSFGSNPGNLNMYKYVPANVNSNAGLVVALHGCTQSANEYADRTGWNDLADQYGFYVVYAEQKSSNNQNACFNWFEPGDISRGYGEALSIKNMVSYMQSNYSIDASRIYVTGLSAGGYMTTVMLATYPDVFSGGSAMAGGPYKCATDMNAAFSCMSPGVDKTPQQWGDLVRNAYSSYSGPYPKVTMFHGDGDYTVKPMNMTEAMEQWTNVNGIDQTPELNETFRTSTHKVYKDSGGNGIVETYLVSGMGHAITVDPGTAVDQGGTTGAYAEDKNIHSSYYSMIFWGLDQSDTEAPSVNITNPANGDSVSGTVNITASASDNAGVDKVEFYVNGTLKSTDSSSPYEYSWDTSVEYNGDYRIMAKAYDTSGNVGQDDDTTVTVTGGAADSTAPSVNVTSPSNGETVYGTVNVTASASDSETGIAKVEFYVDGTLKSSDTSSPYEYSWDTTVYSDGTAHSIKAVAYDGAGNTASDNDTSVTVDQTAADFVETFSSSGPDNSGWDLSQWSLDSSDNTGNSGQSIYGESVAQFNTVTETASIQIDLGDSPTLEYFRKLDMSGANTSASAAFKVEIDGNVVDEKSISGATSYSESSWTQRSAIDLSAYSGTVTLKFVITVTDTGSTGLSYAKAWVDDIKISYGGSSGGGGSEDTTAPTVNITAPSNGSTVNGTVAITADASDNVGVSKVEFYIDGTKVSEDTSSPYEYSWDTTAYADASHSLKAVAYDAAGNIATDDDTSVTVDNSGSGSGSNTTFDNSAANDGYVKCYSDGTSCSAKDDYYGALAIGKGSDGKNNKTILSFDTSGIPDTATITKAYVTITFSSDYGDPWSYGTLTVDVKAGNFGSSAGIDISDWADTADASSVASISKFTSGTQNSSDFNSAGLSALNKTGTTQVRLRFDPLVSSSYNYLFIKDGIEATLYVEYTE
jgi:poly(hydroxyalkanoate) depolymerase family esterase